MEQLIFLLSIQGYVVTEFASLHCRANFVRPEYGGVREGINKSRDAIRNSLSRSNGFSFTHMEDIMHSLIKEGGYGQDEETRKMMKLGYVNALEVRTQTHRIAHL